MMKRKFAIWIICKMKVSFECLRINIPDDIPDIPDIRDTLIVVHHSLIWIKNNIFQWSFVNYRYLIGKVLFEILKCCWNNILFSENSSTQKLEALNRIVLAWEGMNSFLLNENCCDFWSYLPIDPLLLLMWDKLYHLKTTDNKFYASKSSE